MRRTTTLTLTTLTLALGALLVVPTGAMARGVVSSSYENLDYKIDRAWDRGELTRWELDELRALQANADYVIDRAFRDGRVTGKEQLKIDNETAIAVDMFYLYRDNFDMRYVRPAPVVIVTPPVYKPVPHVVVRHGHGHGHHRGHGHHKSGKGGKSHRR